MQTIIHRYVIINVDTLSFDDGFTAEHGQQWQVQVENENNISIKSHLMLSTRESFDGVHIVYQEITIKSSKHRQLLGRSTRVCLSAIYKNYVDGAMDRFQ